MAETKHALHMVLIEYHNRRVYFLVGSNMERFQTEV
jgi:hypothetical protein